MAKLEASVSRIKGSLAFGNARTGVVINAFLRDMKAFSSASSHLNGFLPVNLCKGYAMSAKWLMKFLC
jgi:hypothetical protein